VSDSKTPTAAVSRIRRRLLLAGAVGVAVAGVLTLLRPTPLLESLEGRAHDLRVRAMVAFEEPHPDLVLVAIDDLSLDIHRETLGRWPWPRDVHGQVMTYLSVAGARLVIYDVAFFEPDLDDPESDRELARVLGEVGSVILPFSLLPRDAEAAARLARLLGREESESLLERHAVSVSSGAGEGRRLPESDFGAALLPIPDFVRGAAALGVMNLPADPVDGVVRNERPLYSHRDRLYPSLAFAAARLLEPDRFGGQARLTPRGLELGDDGGNRVRLDREGRLPIRWRGPFLREGRATYPVIPIYQILNSYEQVLRGLDPDVPLESLEGKVVVVGSTAQGLLDLRTTPLSPIDPGMLIHATALDNLLSGDWLRRWGWVANGAFLVAVTLGVAMGTGVVGSGSAMVGVFLLLGTLAGTTGLSLFLYHLGYWTDLATPLLGAGLAFAGAMTGNFLLEGRERRRIRETFSRFVAPEQVRILEADPGALRLGGERVPLTILFSDIRGFTSLSERLPAEEVIDVLNDYLDRMAEIVFRHGGTLDKFMGDGLMAFWGAPLPTEDHAPRAVTAALEMLDAVAALNRDLGSGEGGIQLDIGIGINTGEAVVGQIGSLSRKVDYTAVGDPVNLASRLESMNKELGTRVLVSRATRDAAIHVAEFEAAGELPVKGREAPVQAFQVVGRLALIAFLALLPVLSGPSEAQAQDRLRWSDRVYVPGQWHEGTLRLRTATGLSPDSLALVALAEGFAAPPRWRIEFQVVEGGTELGEPGVLVGENDRAWVLTVLGSTSLEDHVLGEDEILRFIVAALLQALDQGIGDGVTWIAEEENGEVIRALRRQALARTDFSDDLLSRGRAGRLGRQLLRLSAEEVGDQRDRELVAAAGTRGVRVRTVDGEVEIIPDIDAILRLERRSVNLLELDRFLREGGLGEGEAGP
jgi:adenylate cyclase